MRGNHARRTVGGSDYTHRARLQRRQNSTHADKNRRAYQATRRAQQPRKAQNAPPTDPGLQLLRYTVGIGTPHAARSSPFPKRRHQHTTRSPAFPKLTRADNPNSLPLIRRIPWAAVAVERRTQLVAPKIPPATSSRNVASGQIH